MKKLILGVIMLSFAFNAFAQDELTIVTGKFPPFISKDTSKSYLTEVLHEVAMEMGVKFKFRIMPWKRAELMVERLEAWGAIPYVRTPKREKIFDFSNMLYASNVKFFYYSPDGKKKDIKYSGLYPGLKNLKEYRIGGIIGYYYMQPFEDAGLKVQDVTDEKQNLDKLLLGRVDLIPMNETTGWYLIRNNYSPEEVKKFGTLDQPLKRGIAFLMTSKKYPNTQELLTRFNKALKKIKDTGVYQKVINKHQVTVDF